MQRNAAFYHIFVMLKFRISMYLGAYFSLNSQHECTNYSLENQ
jgi:hypothetical protein